MRIDKLLSQMKFCTRSETKQFLAKHHVIVDEKRIIEDLKVMGLQIDEI